MRAALEAGACTIVRRSILFRRVLFRRVAARTLVLSNLIPDGVQYADRERKSESQNPAEIPHDLFFSRLNRDPRVF